MRIGVVGVGGMGQHHCEQLQYVDGAQLTAVCDVREDVARSVAEKYNVKAYTDYREMLISGDVEAIIVATPPWQHPEVTITAAEASIHVFCEKPMAATLEDCDRMIAAADDANIVLMVGQVLRFYPPHQLAKRMIDDDEIGDIVYIETDYTAPYRERTRPDTWFGKMGGFLENGIHKADLINWFGGQAETVSAEVGSFQGHPDWEDYAVVLIRFQGDTIGILRWGSFMGARGTTETIIDGKKGSLRIDMRHGIVWRKSIGEDDWERFDASQLRKHPTPVVAELHHFIECAREGKQPLVDGREGRRAMELVIASYKSANERVKVTLPLQS